MMTRFHSSSRRQSKKVNKLIDQSLLVFPVVSEILVVSVNQCLPSCHKKKLLRVIGLGAVL